MSKQEDMFGHKLCKCGHTRGQHGQNACFAKVPDQTPSCTCKRYAPPEGTP